MVQMEDDEEQSVASANSVLSRDDIYDDMPSVGSKSKRRQRVSIKEPMQDLPKRKRPSNPLVLPRPKRVARGRKVILTSAVENTFNFLS